MNGYAIRVRERERSSKVRRRAPAGGFIWVTSSWIVQHSTHWPHLAVIALSAVIAVVLTIIVLLGRDTWPKPVPPELAERVAKLRQDRWRTARIHPWWRCGGEIERQPHVHMISPEGERRVVTSSESWHRF